MFFLQILTNSLVTGTQVLLLAAGLYVIHAVAKMYHIGLAGIMVVGAYAYYVFVQLMPTLPAFLFAIAITALISIISFTILKSLISKKQDLLALLVSVAMWLVIESILAIIFGSDGKFLIAGVLPTYNLLGITITQIGFWTLLVGAVTAVATYVVLQLLPIGRTLRSIAQHPECASMIGIKETSVQMLVFAAAGTVAGLIGIFTAMNDAATPTMSTEMLITAFSAVLVGGNHNFKGTILASYILVLIPEFIVASNFGTVSFSNSWKLVFTFLIALVLLLLRPQGLLSTSTRKA